MLLFLTLFSLLVIIGCISALQRLLPLSSCRSCSTILNPKDDIKPTYKGSYITLKSINDNDGIEDEQIFIEEKITNKPFKSKLTIQGKDSSKSFISKYFVPGFVLFWAVSYSMLGYYETSSPSGFGDMGGTIGVALIGILFVSLLGALIYEVFKSDE